MLYQMYRKDARLGTVKENHFDDHGDPDNVQRHLDQLKREQPDTPRAMRPLHDEDDEDQVPELEAPVTEPAANTGAENT